MKSTALFLLGLVCTTSQAVLAQNVGIGTTTPNANAILDLSSTNRVLLLPRMNNAQMEGIPAPALGSIIYNTDRHQFMGHVRSFTTTVVINGNPVTSVNNQWLPVSTGPRILAWGIIDTFPGASIVNGSNNFSIIWNGYKFSSESFAAGTMNQYEISLNGDAVFDIDSMMVHVTPMGSGTWDQCVSVWYDNGKITIKFSDVSRIASGDFGFGAGPRRRSKFSFVVYDLRKRAI